MASKPNRQWGSGFIGDTRYHFPVLDSTNAWAAKLLSKIRPKAGTLILADHQTAGRGQIGREWYSDPGLNLLCSCILYPELNSQEQFQVSMAVALAVRDTVATFCSDKDVWVKWPNDIYVHDRKIAGILIQNTLQSNTITSCIAGIGLNVNESDFPASLPNPTSLLLETEHSDDLVSPAHWIDLPTVLDHLVARLTERVTEIGASGNPLSDGYQRVLYRRNIPAHFKLPDTEHTRKGTILHCDEQGRLVLQWEDGSMGTFQHREIEFVI